MDDAFHLGPEADHADQHDHEHEHDHDHENVHTAQTDHDATEAVLASLRAVINDPRTGTASDAHAHAQPTSAPIEGQEPSPSPAAHAPSAIPSDGQVTQDGLGNGTSPADHLAAAIEKSLAVLTQQIVWNQSILDDLNSPGAIQNLAQNLKALGEGMNKQLDTVKDLTTQIKASEMGSSLAGAFSGVIDPALSPVVLRTEYDILKTRYDALLASQSQHGTKRGAGKKARPTKTEGLARPHDTGNLASRSFGSASQQADAEGRKKRSIKLEHIVHKMANRRLGVEYLVSGFDCKGTKELPDPNAEPPKAATSVNGVDEFRPDFKADITAASVKPFIDTVVEDVAGAWEEGFAYDEPDVDREKIINAVHIYWTRLAKRWVEQQFRQRGEVHRDAIARRKQNTYRRQQSLLARRMAAFDSSPLNACKLRALYRTLLTIDFAAPTQDSPDPKRAYTEDEWNAYRKQACGSQANDAHEIIDQYWLSSNVRSLLTILDVYSVDLNARSRKKGKPKQPNPTFHLPPSLWDRSVELPALRPKDVSGLPKAGEKGLVLFRFHVDEAVQRENPEWARGLYDNPPVAEEDVALPSLPEAMNLGLYAGLKPAIREARDKANPPVLSKEQVEEINSRVHDAEGAIQVDESVLDPATLGVGVEIDTSEMGAENGTGDTDYMTFAALSRLTDAGESSMPLTQPFTIAPNPLSGLSGITEHSVGPSPGSSLRARKLGKRTVSQVPGGAATPVPKRQRQGMSMGIGVDSDVVVIGHVGDEEDEEVSMDLAGDASFLDTI